MKPDKKTISMRGKVAMAIVVFAGLIYWLMGKIEAWIGLLYERQTKKENME